MNAVADTGDWDVSYMGVVPAARRCGVGRDMLSAALKAAQFADIAQMTLVVDARNLAAIGLYSSTGFVETERRRLWLYFFNRPSDMKGG